MTISVPVVQMSNIKLTGLLGQERVQRMVASKTQMFAGIYGLFCWPGSAALTCKPAVLWRECGNWYASNNW